MNNQTHHSVGNQNHLNKLGIDSVQTSNIEVHNKLNQPLHDTTSTLSTQVNNTQASLNDEIIASVMQIFKNAKVVS